MSDVFSDGSSDNENYTSLELNLKYSFNYDDYKDFSDLKILDMQNDHRLNYMSEEFGVWGDSSAFCAAFSTKHHRNKLIQRHLCDKLCYWDPQPCFFEDTHSGNLADLMHKNFHDKFNPMFEDKFARSFTKKIDWALTGGLGSYPSRGVKKLIEEMGITTKLSYNDQLLAINFKNLCREFRDSIPVRPLYILEEKKCHDILEAMFDINRKKIELKRKEMEKIFDESFRGNGSFRDPILSLFMWGPYVDLAIVTSLRECKFYNTRAGFHFCTNFSEKHYWMYTHNRKTKCNEGVLRNLQGPVMSNDLKVVYPCNRSGCNVYCLCDLCSNSNNCPKSEHKSHLKDFKLECSVKDLSICADHVINHPKNFDESEDISVDKNVFYHNLELVVDPRSHSVGKIHFAGIKKSCQNCRSNVENHFRYHKVIHMQCKFCIYQMQSAIDNRFWEKVCEVCGKIFPNEKSLKLWHRKLHNSTWKCDECDTEFNRKWNLKRHLLEIHELDVEDVSESGEDEGTSSNEIEDSSESNSSENDTEDETIDNDEQPFKCRQCGKEFSVKRYLYAHTNLIHSDQGYFECSICGKSFSLKAHMKRHEKIVHRKQNPNIINFTGVEQSYRCESCGSTFTRIDNLKRHIQLAHSKEKVTFDCQYCGKSFDRKWNLNRHVQIM